MAFRPATGRKIAVQKRPKDVRALLRRHLREEGRHISDLARVWNVVPTSAYRLFYSNRKFAVQYIEAAIEFLKLDEFDANELRWHGAREAGWNIDVKYLDRGDYNES